MFGFLERGTIVITPEKYNYAPGETVKGTVRLTLKKPTKANKFSIWLQGVDTRTMERPMSMGTVNRNAPPQEQVRNIIYQFELPLDGEKEYTQGEYPFEITLPANVLPQGRPTMPGGVMGGVLSVLATSANVSFDRIDWNLEAALDIPGTIDMRKGVQINVA